MQQRKFRPRTFISGTRINISTQPSQACKPTSPTFRDIQNWTSYPKQWPDIVRYVLIWLSPSWAYPVPLTGQSHKKQSDGRVVNCHEVVALVVHDIDSGFHQVPRQRNSMLISTPGYWFSPLLYWKCERNGEGGLGHFKMYHQELFDNIMQESLDESWRTTPQDRARKKEGEGTNMMGKCCLHQTIRKDVLIHGSIGKHDQHTFLMENKFCATQVSGNDHLQHKRCLTAIPPLNIPSINLPVSPLET